MTGHTSPLHIDFVTTYEKGNKIIRGYWFLTWIIGPDKVNVWCKLHDGNWRLETPLAYTMFPVPNDTETLGEHLVARDGEFKAFMDATLEEYMNANNYTEPIYFYWLKDIKDQ